MDVKLVANETFAHAAEAAASVSAVLPAELQQPRIAVICGSGLGGLQNTLDDSTRCEINYAQIPGFPLSTVPGHEGKMVIGFMSQAEIKIPVLLLVGRAHFYEGHSMDLVTFATRVCKALGVETLIVTNASGGINQDYAVGDIMLLHDHLNLSGLVGIHPLRGPNDSQLGARFPALSDAYDLDLRRRAYRAWRRLRLDAGPRRLHEGVYAFVAGPSYETRAECRMLAGMGADVVGMSTVPEVVVARHAGMRVLAFSLVTNRAVLEPGPRGSDLAIAEMSKKELEAMVSRGRANHEEVLQAGREAAEIMQSLVKQIVIDMRELS